MDFRSSLKPALLALSVTSASIASQTLQADTFFGVYVGAGFWQNQYSGTFTEGGSPIDVESNLNFEDENNNFVYAAIEHPIPLIPNVRLSQTEIENTANTSLNQSITFVDTTYNINASISSVVDLTFSDVTFYYELLDNWISLDLGLAARNFDGTLSITESAVTESVELNATVPLLYAATKAELPFTGFYISGSLVGIGLDDNSVTDLSVNLGYESDYGIGAELGYRSINIDIQEIDELATDLDVDGLYLAATFHF